MASTKARPLGRPRNDSGLTRGWCGDALTVRRLLAGMSMADLADLCETTTSSVSRWENDECSPTAEQVLMLTGIFECRAPVFSRRPKDATSIALLRVKCGRPRTGV